MGQSRVQVWVPACVRGLKVGEQGERGGGGYHHNQKLLAGGLHAGDFLGSLLLQLARAARQQGLTQSNDSVQRGAQLMGDSGSEVILAGDELTELPHNSHLVCLLNNCKIERLHCFNDTYWPPVSVANKADIKVSFEKTGGWSVLDVFVCSLDTGRPILSVELDTGLC